MTTPVSQNAAAQAFAAAKTAKPAAKQGSTQSPLSTIQQDATETIQVTREKAAKGDPAAIRKLARYEAAQKAEQARLTGKASDTASLTAQQPSEETESTSTTPATYTTGPGSGLDAQA